MILVSLLLGLAQAGERTFVYDISLGAQHVGQRTVTVDEPEGDGAQRMVQFNTQIEGNVGPVDFRWRQRVTAFAGSDPASFHAVVDENGLPREVQARWTPGGWTITVNTSRTESTRTAAISRVDVSTVDLMDPATRWPLSRFEEVSVLSAETGEVYKGEVTALGPDTIPIDGTAVDVLGYSWKSPQGTHTFWYDGAGVLVRYTTRLAGREITGVLADPPAPGVDAFAVPEVVESVEVVEEAL